MPIEHHKLLDALDSRRTRIRLEFRKWFKSDEGSVEDGKTLNKVLLNVQVFQFEEESTDYSCARVV